MNSALRWTRLGSALTTRVPPLLHRAISVRMAHQMTCDRAGFIQLTPEAPTAAVIFMHGLGDTAHGWADAMRQIAPELPHVKFVLPTAPHRPVTLNMGMSMTAWYDIKSLDERDGNESEGIEGSREQVLELIEKQVADGIPHSRIVLGGFSQGAALSLFTGFQTSMTLAGILCLSGYIPKAETFKLNPVTKDVPLLMCHGDVDSVVQFTWATSSKTQLENAGVSHLDFRVFNGMDHGACPEEIDQVKQWLQRVLPFQ